jgi:hypothetical protein
MNDYFIGSGALLTAGPAGSIAAATLHAQTDPAIAGQVQAALVDFESTRATEISKVLLVGAGWTAGRVAVEWIQPLLEQRSCTLVDVFEFAGSSSANREVHLFAHWLPDEVMTAALGRSGVTVVAHPLEAIRQAALISGQSYVRWPSPLRAA